MIGPLTTQPGYFNLNTGASASVTALPSQGLTNVATFNGIDVDLSGSLAKVSGPRQTRAAMMPAAPLLDPSSVMELGKFYTLPPGKFDPAKVAEVVKTAPTLATATSLPKELSATFTAAPEPVQSVGYLPNLDGSPAQQIDYTRRELARVGTLAQTEEKLSAQSGVPVRVAFDPIGQDYVMLKPGQAGYDDVPSARSIFAQAPSDLRNMGYNLADFRDVFSQFGVKV